jgi:perosamine synthetase
MTTGEGGALLTNRDDVAAMARSLRNQGRGDGAGWLSHARLGFNYRMSEISAALGTAQLDRLPEILAMRANVARRYNALLAEIDEIEIPQVSPGVDMSWFVYVPRLVPGFTRQQRDRVLSQLRDCGVGCSNYFPCIHLEPFYREQPGHSNGSFPVAESVSDRSIALPFFGRMTEEQTLTVVEELNTAIANV